MKRIPIIFLLFIAALTGCQGPGQGKVTILHTNDMHCQYIPLTATWVDSDPQPKVGGMVALEYFMRQEKAKWPNSLALDAGDFMTGTPLAKMDVNGATGGAFVQMINMVGYDAMTIGNHEFDNGQENLHKLLNMLNLDIVSSNLFVNGKPFVDKPYMIYKVNGVRIGVIGIMLKELFEMTALKNLDGIEVKDPVATAQKYIDEIDPKTDLIILLTHNGVDNDMELANQVHNADIIIGGHSHTRLPKPRKANNVLICQAGSYTRNLGRLTVDVQGDSVAGFDYELINTWADSVKDPNPELKALVDKYQSEIDSEYNRELATIKTAWISNSSSESNLGDFITDAMRKESGADFALMNSGGIRKDLPAGPVTKLNIVEILPFQNIVETFPCTGEQVLQLIKRNANDSEGYHGILQVSGLAYTYRVKPDKSIEIISATIGGQPIDPARTYTGASVDFILDGQTEKYFGFNPDTTISTGAVISDMIMNYLQKNPVIDSKLEGRMQRVH